MVAPRADIPLAPATRIVRPPVTELPVTVGGGGCSVAASPEGTALWLLLGLALVVRRRRRCALSSNRRTNFWVRRVSEQCGSHSTPSGTQRAPRQLRPLVGPASIASGGVVGVREEEGPPEVHATTRAPASLSGARIRRSSTRFRFRRPTDGAAAGSSRSAPRWSGLGRD